MGCRAARRGSSAGDRTDAVLVGGTAAAQHASHRVSNDDYHLVRDLKSRFEDVLRDLESTDGWVTASVKRPVLRLGRLDGVETGIRSLMRRVPLEVETVATPHGAVRVPTLHEMLRIKGWLVLMRNATRDYLDVVALADRVGHDAPQVLLSMDRYYEDQQGPEGRRIATQLARQLADSLPYDLTEVELSCYRGLHSRWHDWGAVADACRSLSVEMLDRLLEGKA